MLLESLLPLFLYFLLGLVLNRTGVMDKDNAAMLLRIVFFVCLPALALLTVSSATLTRQTSLLPACGFLVDLACATAAFLWARRRQYPVSDAGTLVLAAGIANMVFSFPFILAVLGTEALARAVIFDLGNAVFMALVATPIAYRLADRDRRPTAAAFLRLLRTPVILALVAGVVLNLQGASLPTVVRQTLDPLADATILLTMIALGGTFSLRELRGTLPIAAVGFRMLVGVAAGTGLAALLGLDDLTALVVVASSAAPVGFSAVTLANIARLDTSRAAAAVSVSVLVGMLSTTLLLVAGRAALSIQ